MRNFKEYIILYLLLFPLTVYSQTEDDMCKIVIGITFQNGTSEETISLKQLLENRLASFASQAGCSSFDDKAFSISPNIIVNTIEAAEGGMKNVYVVKGDLYLSIHDNNNRTIISSHSFPFQGYSSNIETAIKNGILNIKYDNVASLFIEAKSKILAYYQNKKDMIFARANTCVAEGNYDGAIACLMIIPEDLTDMYEEALKQASYIFDLRANFLKKQALSQQMRYNDSILTRANSYIAMHQPEEALCILCFYISGDEKMDAKYLNYISKAEELINAKERETKRKEDREYKNELIREKRLYREQAKQSAHLRFMDRQELDFRRQNLLSSERIIHHKLKNDEYRIRAIKQVASEYIRNNSNRIDYIRVRL